MSAKKIALYGLLTSVMLVLGWLERFIPLPGFPGVRLGLSNTVLLFALCLMSTRSAWLLMGLKVFLSFFLYGTGISVAYSLGGGVLSMLAMMLALKIRGLGMVGISVCGAAAHMIGQIGVSMLIFSQWEFITAIPLLLIAAVVTGILTGLVAQGTCRGVAHMDAQMMKRLESLGLAGDKKS